MTMSPSTIAVLFLLLAAAPIRAAEHYALVITGASGEAQYADRFDSWRTSVVRALTGSLGYAGDRVVVLAETPSDGAGPATAEGVAAALRDLASRTGPDDVLLVLLIGHGTVFEGPDAKFNLVGPDLTAVQWAAYLAPVRAHVVFVNTAAGSQEFLRVLSRKGRTVISATDAAAQRYATVFPEFFVRALVGAAADLDKSGRVSVWEAFTFASAGVERWFEGQGRLVTERALLDDTGDGVGREAEDSEGDDGRIAQITYLQAEVVRTAAGDPRTEQLLARRQELSDAIDRLRSRQAEMPSAEYDAELEKLLLELARVDRDLRSRP
jgi:hypothetical protein